MKTVWMKNVRMETGFEKENEVVTGTLTEYAHVKIEGGKITAISNDESEIETGAAVLDAKGKLILPSLREMHIHIDKTYYSGPWKACRPITKGIFTRIEEEQELLPKQLPYAQERAEKMIELLLQNGHTHIRTHCNIEPTSGLKHLEVTVKALEKYKHHLTYDIVAFPQHGLLRSNSVELMREAMKSGATLVGGVDPATVDRHIDQSLYTTFDIATEHNAGVDIHLHDPDTLGAFTFERLADFTREANLKGRVTISHAIALGDLEGQSLTDMMAILKDQEIDITTTIPINRPTIPVPTLDQYGLQVSVGHDSLTDHWSPFGTGDTIEKLNILAERFRLIDEYSINRTWKYASGGITPLDDAGKQVWPQVGDAADFVLVEASCSAEAVARRAKIDSIFKNGEKVVLPQSESVLINK
ncbi:amidohydrolase family protein [Rossellomorea aquimaris]|uniref:Amidohydrolase family protein n=1 Tax=Rossellomorea aquimaris TaxID=189382 RepID=A0A5D4U3T1_9BACI|nr:amidohydrolase family protein [Rossellomorea aquimaris]TYS81977.1 amidohydrolase family protein [Rossellomorea aquimaris]TYS88601.1 amidohydrolase family protein [Rossellomorea aquimaris]